VAGGTALPGREDIPAADAGVAAQVNSPSTVPEAESFRSGLQSLLASLNTTADSLGDDRSEPDQPDSPTGPTWGEAVGIAPAAGSTLASEASKHLGRASGAAQAQADTVAKLSATDTRVGAAANRQTGSAESQNSTKVGEQQSTASRSVESADKTRSTRSGKAEQSNAVQTVAMPEAIPTAIAIAPVTAPVIALTGTMARAADTEEHSAQNVFSNTNVTGTALTSIGSRSSTTDRPSRVAEAANTAGSEAEKVATTPEQGGKVSTAASPGSFSSLLARKTQSSMPGEEVSLAEPTLEQARHTLEPRASAQASAVEFVGGRGQTAIQPGVQGADTVAAPIVTESADRLPGTARSVSSEMDEASPLEAIAGKTGSSSSKATTASAVRTTRGISVADSVRQANRRAEEQVPTSAAEVSAMGHGLSDARGAASTSSDTAGSATTTGTGARETFAALDAESAPGKPAWVHAGAQQAEAGFNDPVLGWVGIRADLGSGGVHAAVVPGSASAAETLGGHLAGLNAYLADQHTSVGTVTLAAPQGGWTGSEQGTGQSAHQGASHQGGQETAQGPNTGSQSGSASSSTDLRAISSGVSAASGEMSGSAISTRLGDMHISVIA